MEDLYRMVPWHSHDWSPTGMTAVEIQALYQCREELVSSIDPILLVGGCNMLPLYVKNDVIKMFQYGRDRIDICECLISHLPANINLQALVTTLDGCGYRKLATKLFLTFLKLNMQTSVKRVYRSTSGQRSSIHTFFRNLKHMIHDAQFTDPRLELRRLALRFTEKMEKETNAVQKQILADKCVAIVGAEIDAIAITFDNNLSNSDAFLNMRRLIPYTSNTLVTDVVYFGRLANANSIIGNFEDSESLLVEARCRAYSTGPCLELVNMLYIEVYVKLWQFERHPTREIREALMRWGRIGLEILEEEEMETQIMWRRMFILRMVFCLLGLGNRSNVIDGCPMDEDCKREARELLAEIDKKEIWDGIETRRQMFYYVARARLSELDGKPETCIQYLMRAETLAISGRFTEISFISEYLKRLSVLTMDPVAASHDIESQELDPISGNYVLLCHSTGSSGNFSMSDRQVEMPVSTDRYRTNENFHQTSLLTHAANSDNNSNISNNYVLVRPASTESSINVSYHYVSNSPEPNDLREDVSNNYVVIQPSSGESDIDRGNVFSLENLVRQHPEKVVARQQTDTGMCISNTKSTIKETVEVNADGNIISHQNLIADCSQRVIPAIANYNERGNPEQIKPPQNKQFLNDGKVGSDTITCGRIMMADEEHILNAKSETITENYECHPLRSDNVSAGTNSTGQYLTLSPRLVSCPRINSIALFEERGDPSGISQEYERHNITAPGHGRFVPVLRQGDSSVTENGAIPTDSGDVRQHFSVQYRQTQEMPGTNTDRPRRCQAPIPTDPGDTRHHFNDGASSYARIQYDRNSSDEEHLTDIDCESNVESNVRHLQGIAGTINRPTYSGHRGLASSSVFSDTHFGSIALFEERGEPSGSSQEYERHTEDSSENRLSTNVLDPNPPDLTVRQPIPSGWTVGQSNPPVLTVRQSGPFSSEFDSMNSEDLFGD